MTTTITLMTDNSSDAKRIRELLVDLFPHESMSIDVSGADIRVKTNVLIDALESATVPTVAVSSDQLTLF